jgi:phosphoribosyl 1,2-cyclic phosphodiesterase
MSFNIKYWGVRGSLPSSQTPEQWTHEFEKFLNGFFAKGFSTREHIKEYLHTMTIPEIGGFGAATTCAELKSSEGTLIIDGGSGLKALSDKMMATTSAAKGKATIHIYLTHFHWDHLIGIPFFAPLFVPGNRIHFYAVQPDLEDVIRLKFRKPMFPVPFEALPSTITFHTLQPRKKVNIAGFDVTPYQLDHPDPCWGLRVENEGCTYSHCVDTEGTRVSRQDLGEDLPLYQNVDLMFFDAQYTLPELSEKANWGHSAAQIGLDIAFREKIEHVIFAHHDPGANTERIYAQKSETRDYYNWRKDTAATNHSELPNIKWRYAYEGLEVDMKDIKSK